MGNILTETATIKIVTSTNATGTNTGSAITFNNVNLPYSISGTINNKYVNSTLASYLLMYVNDELVARADLTNLDLLPVYKTFYVTDETSNGNTDIQSFTSNGDVDKNLIVSGEIKFTGTEMSANLYTFNDDISNSHVYTISLSGCKFTDGTTTKTITIGANEGYEYNVKATDITDESAQIEVTITETD